MQVIVKSKDELEERTKQIIELSILQALLEEKLVRKFKPVFEIDSTMKVYASISVSGLAVVEKYNPLTDFVPQIAGMKECLEYLFPKPEYTVFVSN